MKGTFYGWYMKCQSASQTLAVIPAVHQCGNERTCSIQIITDYDAWTHCFFSGGSLMLSVADIPMAGMHFTGIIGVILYHGKEYRLATYLGAKALQVHNGKIRIVHGDMKLEVCLLERVRCSLKAPVSGNMKRG